MPTAAALTPQSSAPKSANKGAGADESERESAVGQIDCFKTDLFRPAAAVLAFGWPTTVPQSAHRVPPKHSEQAGRLHFDLSRRNHLFREALRSNLVSFQAKRRTRNKQTNCKAKWPQKLQNVK